MRTGSTASSTTCKSGSEEILVLAPNWLGDAVMATPFCAVLRRRFPSARVSLLCRSYVAEVFRRSPAVDALVEYERRAGLRGRISAVRRSRPSRGYDLCFVMPPSFAAALVALASGARCRVGYRFEGRRFLMTQSLPGSRCRASHLSEAYLALLELVTGVREASVPFPAVAPPAGWEETVERRVGVRDYAVLAPGATYGSSKVWPIERFGELASRLAARTGQPLVVVGAAAERSNAARILDLSPAPGVNLAGECSVAELLAVLRGSRVTVGNDSGPVHLAAALGVPTVAIFGPTSVDWTAPRGSAVRIVRGEAPCAPCFKRECPQGSAECLLNVSVDEVYHAASLAMEENAGEKGS